MIRRPPRSTPLYSSAASDVYKRQVQRAVVGGPGAGDVERLEVGGVLDEHPRPGIAVHDVLAVHAGLERGLLVHRIQGDRVERGDDAGPAHRDTSAPAPDDVGTDEVGRLSIGGESGACGV